MRKKIILLIIIFLIILGIIGLVLSNTLNDENDQNSSKDLIVNNSLVLYFSVTGNTKQVAEYIKNETESDILEIVPKDKYTDLDLDYGNENSRATLEQRDSRARPLIENELDLSKYDTIYLGYPIWWGDVPKIILTLFDKYNLENKNIILFCTSSSSDIRKSVKTLKNYNKKVHIISGKRFSKDANSKEVEFWIDSLKIKR